MEGEVSCTASAILDKVEKQGLSQMSLILIHDILASPMRRLIIDNPA